MMIVDEQRVRRRAELKLRSSSRTLSRTLSRKYEDRVFAFAGVSDFGYLPSVTDAATMRKIFLLEVLGGES